jgi:very-short-patch-repair endonuclease
MIPFDKTLKNTARTLRKNMTDSEKLLWSKIRLKQLMGFQFYRQKNIGRYIVDFYCPSAKLILELDGGQHFIEKGINADRQRDEYLQDLGFRVLRYSNNEVLNNLEGVLESLCFTLKNPPHPPFRKGGSENTSNCLCKTENLIFKSVKQEESYERASE